MWEFFDFRKMITPVIIQVVFVALSSVLILVGLIMIVTDRAVAGFLIASFGPLIIRIYCEVLILFFKINQTLIDIDDKLSDVGIGEAPAMPQNQPTTIEGTFDIQPGS